VIGPDIGGTEDHCLTFVRKWAEAVLRQVERVRTARRKFHEEVVDRDEWQPEEWSPLDVEPKMSWRSLWAEQHILVWAAHQLEEWACRLAEVRGQQPPQRDRLLTDLRNSLEHLAESEIDDYSAVASPKKGWSLQRLPKGRLGIAVGGDRVFELIDPKILEERAVAVVRMIDAELDALEDAAVSCYLGMEEDRAEAEAFRRAGIAFDE
jgi:hypothetical protein